MSATAPQSWFPDDRRFVSPETYDTFFGVIERLEAALDAESAALASNRSERIAELTRQKRQGFLELNRVMKAMERTIPSQEIIARLAAFRVKLADNEALLRVHLRAVQQVTALIVEVMREQESDGTYSRGAAYGYGDA